MFLWLNLIYYIKNEKDACTVTSIDDVAVRNLTIKEEPIVKFEKENINTLDSKGEVLLLYGELFQRSKVRLNYLDLLCFIHDILI